MILFRLLVGFSFFLFGVGRCFLSTLVLCRFVFVCGMSFFAVVSFCLFVWVFLCCFWLVRVCWCFCVFDFGL